MAAGKSYIYYIDDWIIRKKADLVNTPDENHFSRVRFSLELIMDETTLELRVQDWEEIKKDIVEVLNGPRGPELIKKITVGLGRVQ